MKQKIIACSILILLLLGTIVCFILENTDVASDDLVLYGNIDIRQVDLGFQVSGRVQKLYFEEGDVVHEGDLLATLDKTPYLDRVREAQADLTAIQVNLTNAEKILKRRTELISNGSISQEDLDNALTSQQILTANLQQAEAALAIAQTNLQYTDVHSPTEGTILTRIREPGTVVKEGDPVYTLSIASPVWVRAFISEPELGLVYSGMPAEIHTDTPDGKAYTGQVGFISPVAEFTPKSVQTTELRTDLVYRLRIYADNPDKGLRQGMPVTIVLKPQS